MIVCVRGRKRDGIDKKDAIILKVSVLYMKGCRFRGLARATYG